MTSEPRVTPTELKLETIVLFVSDLGASRTFYEHTLGLRALDATSHGATYAVGQLQLTLLSASEHGVVLPEGQDRSADITFMVDDLPRCRDTLAARGVRFSRTLEYVVGMTTDFYDPDGHWFSLYQASDAARTWPSGPKLEAIAATRGAPSSAPGGPDGGVDLADAVLAYVFLFFTDPKVAEGFYGETLKLEALEGSPCRRIPTSADIGVVKYDVGTTMLATHHVEPEDRRYRVSTVGTNGVAFAFRVDHLGTAAAELSHRGVVLSDWPAATPLGRAARFTDPVGHVLLLTEPARASGYVVPAGMYESAGAAR